ncbi:hypothetical protein [Halomonas chromatireducens]|uniref:hypothetical protein n=1 Tax=Halomonas chromatireducens TaxID=507626 RepID=UPI001187331E|nr:hypothetical protein [Halomonas chromatireducens]
MAAKIISVKVHCNVTGTRYVRLSKIPEPHRTAFIRYLRGAAVPVVEGEAGPVAFETDWLAWLHHRRPDSATGHASIAGQEGGPHDYT